MSEEKCFISTEDYEKVMSQGKKEDMERLLEYALIKFKETKKREGKIKVLNEYVTAINESIPEEQKIKMKKGFTFSMEEMIDIFLDNNPIFYDRKKMLWRWNKEKFFYEQIDITDLGISIGEARKQGVHIRKDFIDLILERARLRIPKEPKNTWIQLKNKIYDYATDDIIEATPEYFITNPLPYEMGESEDTPTIDKLFVDWVGEKYKDNLYEIVGIALTPNQFMQRIFGLVGGGSNGKGTFMDLTQRAVGKNNYTSSELKLLSEKNFETSSLYKKLLCVIGEVGYDDLKNTSQIKKLTGEDEIRFEFKGKNIFSDTNTATIICLTNSLPSTPDKSIGFYRRWLIIDFPNEFPLGKNPVDNIPEEEFRNLMFKCFNVLKRLYKTRKFTNEGNFEERIRKYEEHSNPVMKFIEEFCFEDEGHFTPLREFTNRFCEYSKLKHLRTLSAIQIGKILRNEGFMVGNRQINGNSAVVIVNLRLKTIQTIQTIHFQSDKYIHETTLDLDSSNSSNSSIPNKSILDNFTPEQIKESGWTENELKEAIKDENEQ